ncbi:flagellar biosynthesis anti-sigma factor FlgM [Paenibacillus ferrarius]|uniref:Negative regulator of flagellin synthesis n=1 Tax=Paenibacillus ferrarius TaxID=1469647 RepID=A0A1V4HGG9_9BACL|nr:MULTISPECIES: flagellar biosynthesis anti-sigma factor FlgM [Paenibacillus]NQX70118.1 flagellar biosynthesis anti-sigma factor FlgM [Paenibacillus alba]OPH54569.1 flagellar biosynthesis anti-sigma factor FlgM [Paenibacillus ferrarius]
MKVNEPKRVGPVNPYRQASDHKALNGTNKKEKQRDQVQISSEAKELLLETSQAVQSKERVAKVNQLKQSVESGTYHVDAGKIAEKLLPYFK